MRAFICSLVIVAASVIFSSGQHAIAQSQGTNQALGDIADIVFEEIEKRAIEEYYNGVPGLDSSSEDTDDSEANKNKDKKDKSAKSKKDKSAKGKKDKGAKGKGRGNGLPPGLAKRDQLPPGLAKRGNQLPPGLMKSDLPPDLEKQLPKLPDNVERVVVDDDVLLVQRGTDIILDVLEGVLIK